MTINSRGFVSYFKSTLMYNVPVKFDGKKILPADATKGEPMNVTALDSDGDGKFTFEKDLVIFVGNKPSKENFERVSTPDKLAEFSSSKNYILTIDDFKKAGLCVAFDRNGDGKMEVGRNPLSIAWKRFFNFIGEGPVTYTGKEWASTEEKINAGNSVFKSYCPVMDVKKGTFEEGFIFDQAMYDKHCKKIDEMHKRGMAMGIGGFGWFGLVTQTNFVSSLPPQIQAAVCFSAILGLLVGTAGIMNMMVSKLDPNIPVRM